MRSPGFLGTRVRETQATEVPTWELWPGLAQSLGPGKPVINGVTWGPYKWHYKWVTGVTTLLLGFITPFITGRGPPGMTIQLFAFLLR